MVTDPTLSRLLDLIGRLRGEKREIEHEIRSRLQQIDRQIEGVETTLRLLGFEQQQPFHDLGALPLDFAGARTHKERLKSIAQASGGKVNVTKAADLLLQAGVAKGRRKNVVSSLYTLLKDSDEWQYHSPGTFQLINSQNGL